MNTDYQQRYELELAEKTSRWGWLVALVASVFITYFYFTDVEMLGLENTLPWRVLGLFGPALYLFLRLIPDFHKYELSAYGTMYLMIIIMMSGIAWQIFSTPTSTEAQVFAITTGSTMVWVLIAILVAGGRKVIFYLGSVVLVITVSFCYVSLGVSAWMPYLMSLLLTGILALFVTYNQDRYDRQRAYSVYELEESRDKVRQQAEDLQLANDNLVTFTRAMSHDLQSPLRSVRSFLDLYQKRSKDRLPADTQEYLDLARNYLDQGQAVVTNLLTYSKLGKNPIVKEKINLNTLTERIITELTEASEEPLIHCFETKLEDPILFGDSQLLWHLFSNLLSNAIKFSQSQENPLVLINSTRRDQETIVEVSDNGVGFDQDFSKELGKPFTRLHGAEFKGTGIGLSIVRQVMELHGGHFWAESKVGVGASFFCAFPVMEE